MTISLRVAAIAFTVTCVLACSRPADRATGDTAVPPAAPAPTFSGGDFRSLAWLTGEWRGRMANGTPFYESYRVLDDSTIVQGTHTDSTFQQKSDSATIAFRAGQIVDAGTEPEWKASHLDSAMVDFQSPLDARRHFSWSRVDADHWTARLYSINGTGQEVVTVYQMERVRR